MKDESSPLGDWQPPDGESPPPVSEADRRLVEQERRAELERLRPFILRNLGIALKLRPRLMELRARHGLAAPSTAGAVGQGAASLAIRQTLEALLAEHHLPLYQLPVIHWLWHASDEEVARLAAYCRRPQGPPPSAYYLLYIPAHRFTAPAGAHWVQETGYRVAALTVEADGSRQVWGDISGPGDQAGRQGLRQPGDFLVRGNLESFDTESWRRIGKQLAGLKGHAGHGQALGLVAGGQAGRPRPLKKVLNGRTWSEVQQAIAADPRKQNRLCHEYANARRAEFVERYRKDHGEPPPGEEQARVRRNAINYFGSRFRRVAKN